MSASAIAVQDVSARVEALRPAVATVLAADGWLPDAGAVPDASQDIYTLLPPADDIHFVSTISDAKSVSIHLLANDTACVWRHRFEPATGLVTPFRSGYANAPCRD